MNVETPPEASHWSKRRFSAIAGAPLRTRASGGTAITEAARSAGVTASVFILIFPERRTETPKPVAARRQPGSHWHEHRAPGVRVDICRERLPRAKRDRRTTSLV